LKTEAEKRASANWNAKNPEYMRNYRSSPKGRYKAHLKNAALRGVPFLLSFDEWWKIWEESGKWNERGRGTTQYQMCRTNDEGAYVVGNVRIDTRLANMRERKKS
jgi:hypothetical protein